MGFVSQEMLPHISIEAPTIRNAKSSIRLRETFSERLKFTIVLFQMELISMQSNFNSPQKPNQMLEQKCMAVFLKNNKWPLAQCVQIF